MDLRQLGWDEGFEDLFRGIASPGDEAGRVIQVQSGNCTTYGERGIMNGRFSGMFRNSIRRKNEYPAVGDWVVFSVKDNADTISLKAVLPRRSSFVRKLPISGGRKLKDGAISGGIIEEQTICANIDLSFIVTGLDQNFDIARIERYITLVYNSGSRPVLLLNKTDICENADEYVSEVERIGGGISVHPVSAVNGTGLDIVRAYLEPGKTAVFLGSSGVGKSTLVNTLLGEQRQQTNTTSAATGKGRHTTVKTELIVHPNGSMIIDTPGLRELQLWASLDALNRSYDDIYQLSLRCRFRDCSHTGEPDCAIAAAIEAGELALSRFESYRKQSAELTRLEKQRYAYDKSLSKKERLRMKLKQTG